MGPVRVSEQNVLKREIHQKQSANSDKYSNLELLESLLVLRFIVYNKLIPATTAVARGIVTWKNVFPNSASIQFDQSIQFPHFIYFPTKNASYGENDSVFERHFVNSVPRLM